MLDLIFKKLVMGHSQIFFFSPTLLTLLRERFILMTCPYCQFLNAVLARLLHQTVEQAKGMKRDIGTGSRWFECVTSFRNVLNKKYCFCVCQMSSSETRLL